MAHGDGADGARGITRAEASDIASIAAVRAANETVTKLFSTMGVNVADFNSMEEFRRELGFLRSMVSDSKALREDMDFIRKLRTTWNKGTGRFWITLVTIVSTGLAVSFVAWIKDKLHW